MVTASFGLAATLIRLDRTRSDQMCQRVRHQRDQDESTDDRPIVGTEAEGARPVSEIVEGDGARYRCRRRKPESPHRGDEQDAEEVHHPERTSRREVLEHDDDTGLSHDERRSDRHSQPDGRSLRP